MSVAAYGKTPAGQKDIDRHRTKLFTLREAKSQSPLSHAFDDPAAVLKEAGWSRWESFPDQELKGKLDKTHLRVEVWQQRSEAKAANASRLTIAIAFGGTVFNNGMDWRANLRWFLPKWLTQGKLDEYSSLVRELVPAFVVRLKELTGKENALTAQFFATGHSLGGGLAQQFAYALPLDPIVPRVSRVYAFDPSPVTGFFSVDEPVRNRNRQDLKIDRIYERGEVLAIFRSLASLLWKPATAHPEIRGVRYSLFYSWNTITSHSILRLASKLKAELTSTTT